MNSVVKIRPLHSENSKKKEKNNVETYERTTFITVILPPSIDFRNARIGEMNEVGETKREICAHKNPWIITRFTATSIRHDVRRTNGLFALDTLAPS